MAETNSSARFCAAVVLTLTALSACAQIHNSQVSAIPTPAFQNTWQPTVAPAPATVTNATAQEPSPANSTAAPSPAPVAAMVPPAAAQVARPPAPPVQHAQPAGFLQAAPQPMNYALIVGVEHYRDVPAATGAKADAERFANLMRTSFGIKDDHIRFAVEDRATKSDILSHLSWLKGNVVAASRVYFYFSGHGATEAAHGTPYLLPYDANAKSVETTAVALSDVMKSLGALPAKEVVAFVDSCFSGAGGRSVLPPGARPLMRVKEVSATPQVVMFTASGASEISGPAPGEGVGLFTKYVTTALGTGAADADGDGQISLQEMSDWVTPRVSRDAKRDSRDQNPHVTLGAGVGNAKSFMLLQGVPSK